MQTIVQAICTPGASLRDIMERDRALARFRLRVTRQQTPGRSPGWAKLHSSAEPPRPGAVNVEWNASAATLTCRVVTRSGRRPSAIVGDLVAYLVVRHPARIRAVTVIPRLTA